MRIVCDLQPCQGDGRFRGIGRYSLALAEGMVRQAGSDDIWIALSGRFPETADTLRKAFAINLPPQRIVTFSALPATAYSNQPNNWRMRTGEVLREHFLAELKPDIVHTASIVEGLTEDIVTSVGALSDGPPIAGTFYDAIPLIWPDFYLPNPTVQAWYGSKIEHVKRADLLLAISASARNEAIDVLRCEPDRVVNISTAASDFFVPVEIPVQLRHAQLIGLGIHKPFFLSTVNFEPRKNLENLIRAYGLMLPELRGQFQLVIVCSPDSDGRARLLKVAKDSGLGLIDLVITGYVDDEKLRLLYNACHMFVYPSMHEGFGLPLLEAMQCGAPSIGSNTTSIPEIVGRSDAMFNPAKPAEMSELMTRSIKEPSYIESLRKYAPERAATFSWDNTARRALDALKDTVKRSTHGKGSATGWAAGRDSYRTLIDTCAQFLSSKSPNELAEVASAIAADLEQLESVMHGDSAHPNTRTKQQPYSVRIDEMLYENLSGGLEAPKAEPDCIPLTSSLCRQADFMRDAYRYWMSEIKEPLRFHRKMWEFFYVIQALHERGKLVPGSRGLGFGVGTERLPALFAARGVKVLASDQGIEDAVRAGWAQTGQHTDTALNLNDMGICDEAVFRQNVSFREIDMNAIPADLNDQFDFCWSACCLEHLGSIQHGLDFIVESIRILRPGGVAVHTTEFNLHSAEETIESRDLSLFRKRDIESVVKRLEVAGCHVEKIDWSEGNGFLDGYIDLPPYKNEPHLRLKIGEYDCTSIGLIITKPLAK